MFELDTENFGYGEVDGRDAHFELRALSSEVKLLLSDMTIICNKLNAAKDELHAHGHRLLGWKPPPPPSPDEG